MSLSDKLVSDAKLYAKRNHRTPSEQIEYWARLGKIAEENPDLPLVFIRELMLSNEEARQGKLEPYQFG
ncbi:MAG: hypothetical protein Q9M30_07920 [Mariprofundaceae bacterium]|nr:hypothetical protein [Mariprofundaceae bacterium]